jgi:hypothetical protein
MPDRTLKKAYKSWTEAVASMKAALAANPLVTDPLMASAQVFEDLGRMMFGAGHSKKRAAKRTKAKRASTRKSPAASARKRKKTKAAPARRSGRSKKSA